MILVKPKSKRINDQFFCCVTQSGNPNWWSHYPQSVILNPIVTDSGQSMSRELNEGFLVPFVSVCLSLADRRERVNDGFSWRRMAVLQTTSCSRTLLSNLPSTACVCACVQGLPLWVGVCVGFFFCCCMSQRPIQIKWTKHLNCYTHYLVHTVTASGR